MNADNIIKFLKRENRYTPEWKGMCKEIINFGEKTDHDPHTKELHLSLLKDHLC
jgi:hypothetical protein